jgi:hypothetical protein
MQHVSGLLLAGLVASNYRPYQKTMLMFMLYNLIVYSGVL